MTREIPPSPKPPILKPSPTPPSRIDENLRKVYREMVEEEVPDRFQRLLEQLRQQDR